MSIKQKPPLHSVPKFGTEQKHLPVPNPLRQADSRWQRTVRYGWDKGGSGGGRNGGKSGGKNGR
jgi:hypothetical protein